jgi:hypothetical protein
MKPTGHDKIGTRIEGKPRAKCQTHRPKSDPEWKADKGLTADKMTPHTILSFGFLVATSITEKTERG